MRTYDERRHNRYVKGMRRLREDRQQHGASRLCSCFDADASSGRGAVFDRFADTPQLCSSWCCGNQRKVSGPTRQERRAADIDDWDLAS